jgi:hypothetical protein
MKKTLTTLAILCALANPLQSQTIKTETQHVDNESRQGFTLQRTELDIGNFVAKYDFKNMKGVKGAKDASMIMQKGIIADTNYSSSLSVLNVGNLTGINDETFFDAYLGSSNGDIGLELGTSLRKAAEPRKYFIASAKNFSITDKLKFTTEFGYLSKDPLQENKDRWYGYTALFVKEAYVALGNEINATHIIGGLNLGDVGSFSWYRKDRLTGEWLLKERFAAENIDESYYNTDFQQKATYIVTIPAFFSTYLFKPWGRGDFAAGADLKGDNCSTSAILAASTKTPAGSFAIGTDTRWDSHGSNTGTYLGYINKFSIDGINFELEVNGSTRTEQVDAYMKANIPVGN